MTTISRRNLLMSASAAAALLPAGQAVAEADLDGVIGFQPEERFRPQVVQVMSGHTPGEIHVDSAFHYLYLIGENDTAIRYGVAVGAAGRAFSGEAIIGRKAKWPRWTPTQNMIKRDPESYSRWAGGMPGGPENPLGARALYLFQDGRDTLYRIHGTPQPWTIGRSVSSGCVRMVNEHVTDLYERVEIGSRVIVY